jgi:hypothetical protein
MHLGGFQDDVINVLGKRHEHVLRSPNDTGHTAMHYAAAHGQVRLQRLALEIYCIILMVPQMFWPYRVSLVGTPYAYKGLPWVQGQDLRRHAKKY